MLKHIIFLFGYSTFVTVVWIAATVHHNWATSKISPSTQLKITPIDPTFDSDTINTLGVREKIQVDLSEGASIEVTDENKPVENEEEDIEAIIEATSVSTAEASLSNTIPQP